ncbi:hypothetical protein VIGAN_10167600 [Vigna angularis var. angularis]|uniref:Uncharacterized protein n=1 Tax=Vigna angularis var. angularis TaxID=157739 RepID=A0A0S3T592_PHAAN|nr:hypothetical protein VIGAN_10167600 [Vigna angularis var. angularis]
MMVIWFHLLIHFRSIISSFSKANLFQLQKRLIFPTIYTKLHIYFDYCFLKHDTSFCSLLVDRGWCVLKVAQTSKA